MVVESVWLRVPVWEGLVVAQGEGERVAELVRLVVMLAVEHWLREGVPVMVAEWHSVGVMVRLWEGEMELVGLTVRLREPLEEGEVTSVAEAEADCDSDSVALLHCVAEALPESEKVKELVGETEVERQSVGVLDTVEEELRLEEPLSDGVTVAVRHWVGVVLPLVLPERHSVGLCERLRVPLAQ